MKGDDHYKTKAPKDFSPGTVENYELLSKQVDVDEYRIQDRNHPRQPHQQLLVLSQQQQQQEQQEQPHQHQQQQLRPPPHQPQPQQIQLLHEQYPFPQPILHRQQTPPQYIIQLHSSPATHAQQVLPHAPPPPPQHSLVPQFADQFTQQHASAQPLPMNLQNAPVQPQQIYPDITTMINNNPDMIPPTVQSTFVDPKICQVCGKRSNDMLRHMRIHDKNPRFSCNFPSSWCNYKSINYKRRYEFKRHLLVKHFKFDEIKMGRKMTVSSVLDHKGICPCGLHTTAKVWLDEHILPTDPDAATCPLFRY